MYWFLLSPIFIITYLLIGELFFQFNCYVGHINSIQGRNEKWYIPCVLIWPLGLLGGLCISLVSVIVKAFKNYN